MEVYILGSLLGLGYFLNQTYEPVPKSAANPKQLYRGNIYDHAQYDKVENEVMDRATVKMREAQNIYTGNVALNAPTDTVYKRAEGFQDRSAQCYRTYIDENGQPQRVPCEEANQRGLSMEHFTNVPNSSPEGVAQRPPYFEGAVGEHSAVRSANDEGGIDAMAGVEDQYNLLPPDILGNGGRQGVKKNYEEPWHNNMVPFFGGSIKQNMDPLLNESKLNMYTGQWDYSKKQKMEISPMFAPTQDIKNVYGDQSYLRKLEDNRDRYIPSLMRTNEAPTEKVYVAPGLNLGYDEMPSFGFHEVVRVLPKTTDEIRAKNKPKLTYDRPVVSGKSRTQEGTSRPNLAKNRPELVVNNENGGLTPGAKTPYLRPMEHGIYLLGRALRTISTSFFGPAGTTGAKRSRIKEGFANNSRKTTFDITEHAGPAIASVKRGTTVLNDQKAKRTKRVDTENNNYTSIVGRIYSAVQTYFDKPAKETRKQTTLSETQRLGMRASKYVGTVRDPEQRARTTLKSVTENNKHSGNIGTNAKRSKLVNPEDRTRTTTKQTTLHETRKGGAAGAHTTVAKQIVYQSDPAKATMKDVTKVKDYKGGAAPKTHNKRIYNPEDKPRYTSRQDMEDCGEYVGAAGALVAEPQRYDTAYNATTNALKEVVAEGRAPTQTSVKVVAGAECKNVEIRRIESDVVNPRGFERDGPDVNRVIAMPPTSDPVVLTKDKNTVQSGIMTDRNEPAILDAYRNNPYTQSLSSYIFP